MANPSAENNQSTDSGCDYTRNYENHTSSGNQFYNRTKRKRESSDGNRSNRFTQETNHQSATWKLNNIPMTPGIIGLHNEIEAFVDWIVPNETEHNIRMSVIERIRNTIHEVYPDCSLHIFGSFGTGLYLPTSDLDLVLVGKWDQIPFDIVSKGIQMKNIAKPGTLQLLEHATVPIIKLTDNLTNIKVDISFNMTSGLKSVQLINFFKSRYPALSKLIYVLKQFLLQRDLNEVYTGGLSSYALILMVVSFLQLHIRSDARSKNPNLGVLLVEFFELYGRHFNYANTAISVVRGGAYLSKDEVRNSMTMGLGQGQLCIQDPYNSENDVGKSSYGIPVVRTAFEKAYVTLSQLVMDKKEGILSTIIQVSDEVINFRNWAETSSNCWSFTASNLNKDVEEPQTQSFLEDLLIGPDESQDRTCEEFCEAQSCQKNCDKISNDSSSNSSDSASLHTDEDFDGLDCDDRSLSPSGSSSSAMSVSPPTSESGSRETTGRQFEVSRGLSRQSPNFKEKKERFNDKNFSRYGNRYVESRNPNFKKGSSEGVLDWRKGCLIQESLAKPSSHVSSKITRDQSNSDKPKGDEMKLNHANISKVNKQSSIVNVNDEKQVPLKPEKRSDITLIHQAEPREPQKETQGGSGNENNKARITKKKKKNQNRSQLLQTKNVDINLPVNNLSQSATNKDPTNLTAVKQDTKRSDEEDKPKKDHQSQQIGQIQNQAQTRFSSRVGHSKLKR